MEDHEIRVSDSHLEFANTKVLTFEKVVDITLLRPVVRKYEFPVAAASRTPEQRWPADAGIAGSRLPAAGTTYADVLLASPLRSPGDERPKDFLSPPKRHWRLPHWFNDNGKSIRKRR